MKKLTEIDPSIKFENLPFGSIVEKCHNFKGERNEIEKLISKMKERSEKKKNWIIIKK